MNPEHEQLLLESLKGYYRKKCIFCYVGQNHSRTSPTDHVCIIVSVNKKSKTVRVRPDSGLGEIVKVSFEDIRAIDPIP